MKDFNKYFIVGTNSDALHDTMNGMVVGELIRCKDCKYNLRNPRRWNDDDEVYTYIQCKFMNPDDYCSFAKPKETETT